MHQIVDLWQSDSCLRSKDVQSPLGFLWPQSTPEHFNPSHLWLHTLVYIWGSVDQSNSGVKGHGSNSTPAFVWLKKRHSLRIQEKMPNCRSENESTLVPIHLYVVASQLWHMDVILAGLVGQHVKKVSFCNLYICWIWVNSTGHNEAELPKVYCLVTKAIKNHIPKLFIITEILSIPSF